MDPREALAVLVATTSGGLGSQSRRGEGGDARYEDPGLIERVDRSAEAQLLLDP